MLTELHQEQAFITIITNPLYPLYLKLGIFNLSNERMSKYILFDVD